MGMPRLIAKMLNMTVIPFLARAALAVSAPMLLEVE
jgi:hypothetical protein